MIRMNILGKMRKNKKIHFILKVLKHLDDKEYVDFFLNRESDPLLLEFKSNGDKYREKRFYLINEVGKGYGFFAEFHTTLSRLAFADTFALTPVVYWGEEFLYYDLEKSTENPNAFEWFFKQPTQYSKIDLEQANLVLDSKLVQAAWIEGKFHKQMDLSPEYEEEMARICRKYVYFREEIKQRLDDEINRLLQYKCTLGVHFRGTDFKLNYDNHPVNVEIDQEFSAIDEALKTRNYEQIFLATDEIDAVKKFKERYGNMVVWYSDVYRGQGNTSVAFSESDRKCHKYKLAYEVIRDVFTLSMCQGFIAGVSQVSICARIIKKSRSEQYDFLNIIDNGKNHNKRLFIK